MANTRSARKNMKKAAQRRQINLARRTALKTATKKVIAALDAGSEAGVVQELFRDMAAKAARARGKGVLHARTASRKVSRLAKRITQAGL
jgi:small subunit ribosomal protein S20